MLLPAALIFLENSGFSCYKVSSFIWRIFNGAKCYFFETHKSSVENSTRMKLIVAGEGVS